MNMEVVTECVKLMKIKHPIVFSIRSEGHSIIMLLQNDQHLYPFPSCSQQFNFGKLPLLQTVGGLHKPSPHPLQT